MLIEDHFKLLALKTEQLADVSLINSEAAADTSASGS